MYCPVSSQPPNIFGCVSVWHTEADLSDSVMISLRTVCILWTNTENTYCDSCGGQNSLARELPSSSVSCTSFWRLLLYFLQYFFSICTENTSCAQTHHFWVVERSTWSDVNQRNKSQSWVHVDLAATQMERVKVVTKWNSQITLHKNVMTHFNRRTPWKNYMANRMT